MDTKIELHIEQCVTCQMKETLSRLEYNIAMAAEWLQASGYCAEISFISRGQEEKTQRKLKAIESGLKISSRRDFFLSILDKGK